jgi:hypothetical protein
MYTWCLSIRRASFYVCLRAKKEKMKRTKIEGKKRERERVKEGCTARAQSLLGRTGEKRLQKHGDDLRAISEYMQMQIFI